LPKHLDFAINGAYAWFSRSSTRQEDYRTLYMPMNDGLQPLKLA